MSRTEKADADSGEAQRPQWPQPLVAVDIVAFTVLDAALQVLLIRRGLPPAGLALPGGFVRCGPQPGVDGSERGEDLEAAARRELDEETHLPAPPLLRQIGVWGAPDRDPRARVISVCFFALVRPDLAAFVRAGTDAGAVRWTPVDEARRLRLAFDHHEMLERAVSTLRGEIDSSAIARELVPSTFTVAELRAVVDTVNGTRADPANFRRRLLALVEDGVVREAPGHRVTGRRHATVYEYT